MRNLVCMEPEKEQEIHCSAACLQGWWYVGQFGMSDKGEEWLYSDKAVITAL